MQHLEWAAEQGRQDMRNAKWNANGGSGSAQGSAPRALATVTTLILSGSPVPPKALHVGVGPTSTSNLNSQRVLAELCPRVLAITNRNCQNQLNSRYLATNQQQTLNPAWCEFM